MASFQMGERACLPPPLPQVLAHMQSALESGQVSSLQAMVQTVNTWLRAGKASKAAGESDLAEVSGGRGGESLVGRVSVRAGTLAGQGYVVLPSHAALNALCVAEYAALPIRCSLCRVC